MAGWGGVGWAGAGGTHTCTLVAGGGVGWGGVGGGRRDAHLHPGCCRSAPMPGSVSRPQLVPGGGCGVPGGAVCGGGGCWTPSPPNPDYASSSSSSPVRGGAGCPVGGCFCPGANGSSSPTLLAVGLVGVDPPDTACWIRHPTLRPPPTPAGGNASGQLGWGIGGVGPSASEATAPLTVTPPPPLPPHPTCRQQ